MGEGHFSKKVIKGQPLDIYQDEDRGAKLSYDDLFSNKIVNVKEIEAMKGAEKIIKEAEGVARNRLREVDAIAKKLREEAVIDGYRDGLRKAIKCVAEARKYYIEAVRRCKDDLMELSLRIAKKIVMEELKIEPHHVIQILRRVIKEACEYRVVSIRVARTDYELIKGDSLLLKEISDIGAVVICDDAIEAGGIVVMTENGTIDASIRARYENIERIFKNG